jgi:glycine cleavage system pyridoxal-binding protein P
MVRATGFATLSALIDATVPAAIRRKDGMPMGKYTAGMTESQFLEYFKWAGWRWRTEEGVGTCMLLTHC